VLELAILGLLKEHPMHGYDLRKRLRGDFGLLSSLSFGSLYPALARLEAAGAVHELVAERSAPTVPSSGAWAFPHAGSIAGERAAFRARLASRRAAPARTAGGTRGGTRGRRVYELTARGDEVFHRLLETEEPKPEDGRGFALRWAFARHLSPQARLRLLQRRRAQLIAVREGSRRAVDAPLRPLDRYERSLIEHAIEVTDHDLSWIDRLIASEQTVLPASTAPVATATTATAAEVPPADSNAPAAQVAAGRESTRERSEP
jgi:DNA-binding PadR family transcriptional regulator